MPDRFNSLTGEVESKRITCVDNSNVFFSIGYTENVLVKFLRKVNKKRKAENKNRRSFKVFYLFLSTALALILFLGVLNFVLLTFFLVLNPIIEWNYNNIYLVKYIEDSEEYKNTQSLKLEKEMQEQLKAELEYNKKEIEQMNDDYKKKLMELDKIDEQNINK